MAAKRGGVCGCAPTTCCTSGCSCARRSATGRRPFDATGREQLDRRAEPLRRARRGLPRAFAHVVDGCLEPEPRDRPALADLEAELDAL